MYGTGKFEITRRNIHRQAAEFSKDPLCGRGYREKYHIPL
jgi:hypothetical protein